MNPKDIRIEEYNYNLPELRIAKYPLEERDHSKLLIYQRGDISETIFKHIADHIPEGSMLVFNETRVIHARLIFQKPTGGIIEIFCLEPGESHQDIQIAMLQKIGSVEMHGRWSI
jgi:S-adenosylmethionine:tRNA ribosyltransferase-isomerase